MFDWLASIVGEDTAPVATYIAIFILLIIGFFILRGLLNRMRGGTFVHGGHGRKKRLSVIDAAPVDNRRRLVLVRRDDVEHLVLIGGMNDLVVERDIDLHSSVNVGQATSKTDAQPRQPQQAAETPTVETQATDANATPAPSPAPKPQPTRLVAEPSPKPTLVQTDSSNRDEVAPPTPRQNKPTPIEVEKPTDTTVKSGAAVTASTLATAQLVTQDAPKVVSNDIKQANEKVSSAAHTTEPSFSDFVERETEKSTATVSAGTEPKIETATSELVDEFVPIRAPEPTIETRENVPPVVNNRDKEDLIDLDADLEDEMEQLLNKLTSSSTPS